VRDARYAAGWHWAMCTIMSLVASLMGKGPNGFGYGSTAEDVTKGVDLTGRTLLVTGCNSGIGLETARVLVKRGARVIGTARTEEKARAALTPFGGKTLPVACELSEPSSIRACVEAVKRDGAPLDAIVCNAGIMALPNLERAHGYELQFFTNHLGHFILVTGLLARLAPTGRIVLVSSAAHTWAPPEGIAFDNLSGEKGYSPNAAYGQSKLANLLFAKELAKRVPSGQTANAVHPGVIATNLGRHMSPLLRGALTVAEPLFLKTPPQGAATQTYVATHPDAAALTGEYFANCNVAKSSRLSRDPALAARLWDESERIAQKLS
jgi:NAD(P)-dependent dehydrogenase (short-subunit alcohol dehydrogenase family)